MKTKLKAILRLKLPSNHFRGRFEKVDFPFILLAIPDKNVFNSDKDESLNCTSRKLYK